MALSTSSEEHTKIFSLIKASNSNKHNDDEIRWDTTSLENQSVGTQKEFNIIHAEFTIEFQ